jgi:large subunit ribosomal protein L35
MSKIKMKTHSGAKKRFRVTGGKNKKIKRHQMHKRHILTKKSAKRKMRLRGTVMVGIKDEIKDGIKVGIQHPIFKAIARMLRLK